MTELTIENIEEIKQGYIVGFFDAEGNIDISKDYVLRILINQAHKDVLERINKEFKMVSGIQVHSKEGYDKNGYHHKNAWRWRLSSDDAIPFLKYILPYSIEKRPQVELAIKYQETMTSHKNSRRGSMFRLSQTEIETREWFKKEINDLKYVEPNEQTLKNYNNEIKKLSISKDIRDGKQTTLIPLDEMYKYKEIDITEPEQTQDNQYIPKMTDYIEIGYFSGFYDGEGYVSVSKGKKDSYTLKVAITNTNFDMLKMYETKFGGKIRKMQKDEEHYKEKYQWNIDHNNALPFLKQIQPFTIVKRKQVDLAIEFQEWHNQIKIIRTPEQKKKAEWYYNTIMDMKKETGEKIPNIDEESQESQEPQTPLNAMDKYMNILQ